MRRWAMVLTAMCVAVISSAGECPVSCECKWKSGKESVLCEGRNLNSVPRRIDSGTQLLDMSNNNLTSIREDEFSSAQLLNLQKVFLSHCSLRTLHRHAFRNLINLVDLDLSHNLLSSVPSHTFEFIPSLTELRLNGNPIPTVRNNTFRYVPQLNKLDLSQCRITYLESGAFSGLESSLEWLKLNDNRLVNVRTDSLMILGNLKGLELAGNQWNCSCNLRPLREWVLRNNIPQTVSPLCLYPERLRHRQWDKLELNDFACLPRVLADSYQTGHEGDNVTIECVIKSVPTPLVRWLKKDKIIGNKSVTNGNHFTIKVTKSDSTLMITHAEFLDSGEYVCRAENKAGRAEARVNLTISMKPDHPPWSAKVIVATAAVIILFSLAAVLLLICACCLWRKQQHVHRHHTTASTGSDSYEMNHKTPNSYEKVINYGTEVKADAAKARGREICNGYIATTLETAEKETGDPAAGGGRMWGSTAPPGLEKPEPASPDLHIPARNEPRYNESSPRAPNVHLSPTDELTFGGLHTSRKGKSSIYASSNETDNYPDLLETDNKCTLPRRGYRPRRTRTGSFGSESLSPLLQGSSDESCDGTPMPLLNFPDPYPELDKFLKEYRNLQEQLHKMKESCENLKQDNLRFKAEYGSGGEPKTISRLMDEVYKTGDVEPMYSVYTAATANSPSVDPMYNASKHLLNDSLGNVLLSASTPNNNPQLSARDESFWFVKGKMLNSLTDSNPTKSFYES